MKIRNPEYISHSQEWQLICAAVVAKLILMKKAILTVALILFPGLAAAQTAPIANAATAPESTVPKMNCPQPVIPRRFSAAPEDMRYFAKQVDAYRDCVAKYVEQRQTQTQMANAVAKAEADAGNAAVNEINAYAEQVKAFEVKNNVKQ